MNMVALSEGTLFAGRYRIGKSIAHGGMGAVYEATHTETERCCALKVMLPDLVQSREMRDRFRQEARVAAQVQSEFIVDVLDAGIDEATRMPFLVMELLVGEELHKRLKRVGHIEPQDVATYIHQAALALDKTHKANIVHRDLKPANIFLTEREDGSPRIKLLDFGIAKLVAEGATNAAATRSLGTPLYMAPEQFNMGQKISPATDIYALGMVAYTLLVGVPYWQEEASAGANVFMFAGVAMLGPTEPASVRALRRGVRLPDAFDAWFAKVTAAAPSNRFATAGAAALALNEALRVALPAPRAASVLPAEPSYTPPPIPALPHPAQTLAAPTLEAPTLFASPSTPLLEAPTQTSAATTLMKASTAETPKLTPSAKHVRALIGVAVGLVVALTAAFVLLIRWEHSDAPQAPTSASSTASALSANPTSAAPSVVSERPTASGAESIIITPAAIERNGPTTPEITTVAVSPSVSAAPEHGGSPSAAATTTKTSAPTSLRPPPSPKPPLKPPSIKIPDSHSRD